MWQPSQAVVQPFPIGAMAGLCPPDFDFMIYDGLAAIPPFNPDLDHSEHGQAPPEVTAFRFALQVANAIVISSPEYAHSLPGSLKNALDWVVGSGELSGKPVAILTPSVLSQYIKPVLTGILSAMNAHVVEEASMTVPGVGRGATAAQILAFDAAADCLRDSIEKLTTAATELRS